MDKMDKINNIWEEIWCKVMCWGWNWFMGKAAIKATLVHWNEGWILGSLPWFFVLRTVQSWISNNCFDWIYMDLEAMMASMADARASGSDSEGTELAPDSD